MTELTKLNLPSILLSPAISRSPWWTLISTCVCPSAAVEKTCSTKIPFQSLCLFLSAWSTDLTLLGWNRGVTIDQFSEHTTQRFDTQRQWCHIEKKKIRYVTTKDTTLRRTKHAIIEQQKPKCETHLNSGTHGNSLIRIDWFIRCFTE